MLSARMAEYEEDQTEFALLSLVKDPLPQNRLELAENVKCMKLVDERLEELNRNNELSAEPIPRASNGTSTSLTFYGLCEADVEQSIVSSDFTEILKLASSSSDLNHLKDDLKKTQSSLKSAILDETQAWSTDMEKASHRRHDYSPLIESWLQMLIDNEEIKGLVDQAS